MGEEIKVTVCKYPDRENLVLRYIDPVSGKQKTKSAGTPDEAKAIGAAAVWEDELRSGRYVSASKITWAEFRKRHTDERLSAMPESTQVAYRVALDHFQRIVNPDRLCKVTSALVSRFQAEARKEGMKATTLARHLRHIKATLRWAERQGMIAKAPTIEMPKREKGVKLMKGRPIVEEEFERLLLAVPKVRPHDAAQWKRLLRGLWLSGLRLGEAVAVSWDDDAPFYADLSGKYPRFRILGKAQKSGRDELLPMTPDFAQFLQETPEAERAGNVFKIVANKGGFPIERREAGRIVSSIGEKAGIIVDKATKKYASAHDLRRSFGTRWAKRVMPAVLKRLMRHADIATTMAYYVDMDADEIAADLWATQRKGENSQEGNKVGNMEQKTAKAAD